MKTATAATWQPLPTIAAASKRPDTRRYLRHGRVYGQLNGPTGLLVGIVYAATVDYFEEKPGTPGHDTAVSFFRSDWYRAIFQALGLPALTCQQAQRLAGPHNEVTHE